MSFVHLMASVFLFAFFYVPSAWALEDARVSSAAEELDGTYERTYFGRRYFIGKGIVRTWVKVDARKRPVAFGALLTSGALENLPRHEMVALRMRLPFSVPPYKEVEVNWNPHGHEPDSVYDIPHFDFHFYMYPYSIRSQVTCEGADLARCEMRPQDRYVPQDFVWTPGGVPKMGSHWIDPHSPEWKGETFTHTMIQGFYDGSLAFIEPMITRAFMLTKVETSLPVKQAPEVEKSGWYPSTYRLKFNSARDRYEVSMEDLVYRTSDSD